MTHFLLTAAGLSLLLMTAFVNAEPQANAPSDMKMTDDQCVVIWKQAEAADTVKADPDALPLDAVRPYIKDLMKADPDANGLISTKEWAAACKAGLVTTSPAVPPEQVKP